MYRSVMSIFSELHRQSVPISLWVKPLQWFFQPKIDGKILKRSVKIRSNQFFITHVTYVELHNAEFNNFDNYIEKVSIFKFKCLLNNTFMLANDVTTKL